MDKGKGWGGFGVRERALMLGLLCKVLSVVEEGQRHFGGIQVLKCVFFPSLQSKSKQSVIVVAWRTCHTGAHGIVFLIFKKKRQKFDTIDVI